MSPYYFESEIEFHAVGQGLFSTGEIRCPSASRPLRWVFDCGTTSRTSLLTSAIDRVSSAWNAHAGSRPLLDLVFISHFDEDHVKGIVTLLQRFRVDTLVLPYLSLATRLAVAFIEGTDTQQDSMRFYVDPVAYVAGLPGAEGMRIILVPGSTGEPPRSDDDAGSDVPPDSDAAWTVHVDSRPMQREDYAADVESSSEVTRLRSVELLRSGGRIRASTIWEFLPYNDPLVKPLPSKPFVRLALSRRDALIRAPIDPTRQLALLSLKSAYDRHFGRSARARNEISLFVYGGTIKIPDSHMRHWTTVRRSDTHPSRVQQCWHREQDPKVGPGLLYTGDGYLNTRSRLASLKRYLGPDRFARVHCLQVMHHGAKGNWHPGVAAALAPCVSVFSSDPTHQGLGHPHAEVVRDFLPYGPIQVDSTASTTCQTHWNH